ncbi:MAG TPA: ribosomal protein S18-alanine N-acetyltransferase [Burkholderiales bacterium]|nr:ribosomal protein S18-alanine N-acetyltransferase [Burkholderiales bacterium]
MSAQLNPSLQYRCMNEGDLDAVMAIENVIYTHPWTRGNFTDSLKTGSHCWVMELSGVMIGYAVLMAGAGEVHLLNLSVAAAWQRRGLGREFLQYLIDFIKKIKMEVIFLEVRVSNTAARALYAQAGFREIGTRRGYYPSHEGREDAIVLELKP